MNPRLEETLKVKSIRWVEELIVKGYNSRYLIEVLTHVRELITNDSYLWPLMETHCAPSSLNFIILILLSVE